MSPAFRGGATSRTKLATLPLSLRDKYLHSKGSILVLVSTNSNQLGVEL